jgi:hypothetical protein
MKLGAMETLYAIFPLYQAFQNADLLTFSATAFAVSTRIPSLVKCYNSMMSQTTYKIISSIALTSRLAYLFYAKHGCDIGAISEYVRLISCAFSCVCVLFAANYVNPCKVLQITFIKMYFIVMVVLMDIYLYQIYH